MEKQHNIEIHIFKKNSSVMAELTSQLSLEKSHLLTLYLIFLMTNK
jgi:hypothetical protein